MYCAQCGTLNDDNYHKCTHCGSLLHAPPPVQYITTDETVLSRLIPYKNVPALVSYYCAVFAIIPFAGLFLGLTAFVLGIIGLRIAQKNPECRGKVHAWIGIIGGAIFGFGQLILIIIVIADILRTFR